MLGHGSKLIVNSIVLCSVIQIIVVRILSVNPFAAMVLNAAGSPTLLCILGGQLLINLNAAAERGANGGTNFRSFGSMKFDSPEVRSTISFSFFRSLKCV